MFNYEVIKNSCSLSLLDRYLLQKLSWFFLFSVGLLSALGVAIGTVADLSYKITEYGLPIFVACQIFCYKIPEYTAYALPISTLLTGLIIYGRLNSDRELVALFSFGVSYCRVVFPALLLSLAITFLTFLLNELIVPAANYQANLLQTPYIAETELNLQQQDIFYAQYKTELVDGIAKLRHLYYAEQYQQPNLLEVTVISFDRDNISQIITAQTANWNRARQVWNLYTGKINKLSNGTQTVIEFEFKQIPLSPTIFEIISQERSPEDMNIRQAQKYLNILVGSGSSREIAKFAVRIEQKYAFPFICIVFALIGSALGIKYEHNRAKSFGLCVAIAFGYYCLGFFAGALGIIGVISPFWAAWLPNLIGSVAGLYLLLTSELK